MATLFPGTTDNGTSLPYPSALSKRNGPSLAGLNDNQNDAIIATQTKLGTSASTPTASNLLIGTGVGMSAWSKLAPAGVIVGSTDTITLTNKTLTSPTITSPIITNASITTDLISGFTTSNSGTVFGVPVTTGVIQTAGTVSGASLVAASVGTAALATNAVQGNQLATSAITLGYAQITTNFITSSTTVVQVTGLTATVTIPAGSRRTKITVCVPVLNATANVPVVSIWDGVVVSGTQLQSFNGVSGTFNGTVVMAVVAPSAGSKTYNVGVNLSGAGTLTFGASSAGPGFILVEAI